MRLTLVAPRDGQRYLCTILDDFMWRCGACRGKFLADDLEGLPPTCQGCGAALAWERTPAAPRSR